ncbi:MAG: hypothetical protein GF417_11645 [Candidatus Latescibacteria bacterium]|nr:hypothetical protein [bacterium]MBD3425078.1 hypothetical protein [Candidatus Latescibacterota bacterium]
MKRKRRRAVLITLSVVAAVLVISTVALRMIFTRERLLGIIVPRAEKALDAGIEVGDIGIEFPFGFGVEARSLTFRKELEENRKLTFSSETVSVKASLVSLIRRKPRLSRVILSGARVELSDPVGGGLNASGISSSMSLTPVGEKYRIDFDITADSLTMHPAGGGERTGVAGIELRGEAETEMPQGGLEGELFPASVVEAEMQISDFLLPVEISRTEVAGIFRLSGLDVESDNLTLRSGGVKSEIKMKLRFNSSGEPERIDFQSSTGIDAGEVAAIAGAEGIELSGKASVDLGGYLFPAALNTGRIPGKDSLSLNGKLLVEELSADAGNKLPPVSGLNMSAVIDQGGMNDINARFLVGKDKFALNGRMMKLIPALHELYLISAETGGGDISAETFGRLFGRMQTGSRIEISLEGEHFDLSPFISTREDKAQKEKREGKKEGVPGVFDLSSNPAVANPLTLLILKNSRIIMEMNTLDSPFGPVTGVRAELEAKDGRVKIMPVQAGYSGGRIESASSLDFNSLASIPAVTNFSAEGVDARELLANFFGAADIVYGKFDLNGTGRMTLTPHADPINSLHARTALHSDGGGVNFSRLVSPISLASGIDLSRYEDFSFRSCDGNLIVSGGRMLIKKLEMVSGDGRVSGSGTIGFDKTLDCRARFIIPPEAQRRMKDLKKLGDIVEYLKDDSGNLVLSFDIGGTTESPAVRLDQSGIREKAKEKLTDELKKKAVEKLKDLF